MLLFINVYLQEGSPSPLGMPNYRYNLPNYSKQEIFLYTLVSYKTIQWSKVIIYCELDPEIENQEEYYQKILLIFPEAELYKTRNAFQSQWQDLEPFQFEIAINTSGETWVGSEFSIAETLMPEASRFFLSSGSFKIFMDISCSLKLRYSIPLKNICLQKSSSFTPSGLTIVDQFLNPSDSSLLNLIFIFIRPLLLSMFSIWKQLNEC